VLGEHLSTDQGPVELDAYARLAVPAIQANGGRFLARSNPGHVFEAGQMQRVVVIEFDSIDRALSAAAPVTRKGSE
jgi:uncharacterized protein (DUF1330 family)